MPRSYLALLLIPLLALAARAATVNDPTLTVQKWIRGLEAPTGLAFISPDQSEMLAIEKNTGRVKLIRGRTVVGTVLDLPVANNSERGLLGIAVSPRFATDRQVYLYYTSAAADGGAAVANRIDRYRWTGSSLVFDQGIRELPVTPGPNHNGGKLAFGPDGRLYAVVGDLNHRELTQNFETSTTLSRTSMILRLNPSGSASSVNPFYSTTNRGTRRILNDIYAYGIRNSFGLAFDPVTGTLWDSENGPDRFDEINRVRPGFNSGWRDLMGPLSRNGGSTAGLVSLGSKAFYSDPAFSWQSPVAPTAMAFLSDMRLGRHYRNDLFVGDFETGSIFHFDLSATRKSLLLPGALADGVADNSEANLLAEQQVIVLGNDFGVTTDILAAPRGLYVVSLTNNMVYRITRADLTSPAASAGLAIATVPEPSALAAGALGLLLLLRRRRGRNEQRLT